MIRKPRALTKGSTIGVVAPASPAQNPARVARGIETLKRMGFRVILAENALKSNRYLAGKDDERLADLLHMFRNPQIDGIVCLRGGYGTMRLLNRIDYRAIRQNPKVFVGYSDITALQLAIEKRTGLVTFAGPMLASEFGGDLSEFTKQQFLKAVANPAPIGTIPTPPGKAAFEVIRRGQATGRLTGGNLSLVVATLGTPYEIDTRGRIVFLEEIGEEPYRVDRMLNQLKLAKKLKDAAGVVFGECVNCGAEPDSNSFTLLEVLKQNLSDIKAPVFYGLPAGHGAHQATLPFGVEAELDADNCRLTILEAATII